MQARHFFPIMILGATAMADESYKSEIEPLLVEYCFDCHGDGSKNGDFRMDGFKDLSTHLGDREHWMPVWRNLRSQIMPPSDEAQPSAEEKRKLLAWTVARSSSLASLPWVTSALGRRPVLSAERTVNTSSRTGAPPSDTAKACSRPCTWAPVARPPPVPS
jgi:hypothetical protein